MAASADESVNRIGIEAIKLLQGGTGFRGTLSRGSDY
jgi:hypothetical protein